MSMHEKYGAHPALHSHGNFLTLYTENAQQMLFLSYIVIKNYHTFLWPDHPAFPANHLTQSSVLRIVHRASEHAAFKTTDMKENSLSTQSRR